MGDKKKPQPAPATQQPQPDKKAAPPAPQPGAEKKEAPRGAAPPVAGDQGKDLSETPVVSADKKPDEKPTDTPNLAGPTPWTPWLKPQVTVPAQPIDWLAMRRPFLDRGLTLSPRDADQMEKNWTLSYNTMIGWGLTPDLAVKVANIGTPLAYDFSLQRDNPTTLEKFDLETEKMLPPGKKLSKLVVPVITPETLSWTVEKLTGKKIDFKF